MTRAKGRRAMAKNKIVKNDDVQSEDVSNTQNEQSGGLEDREFYNIFDGTKGRSDGLYLDMQERVEAERARAALEGREPDLSDPGKLLPGVGTPMVVDEMRVDNSYYSNPSIHFTGTKDVDPVLTAQVDTGTQEADVDLAHAAQVARERRAQEDALSGADTASSNTTDNTNNQDYTI